MARRRRAWDLSRSTLHYHPLAKGCALHVAVAEWLAGKVNLCTRVRNWKSDGHFNQLVAVIGRCDTLEEVSASGTLNHLCLIDELKISADPDGATYIGVVLFGECIIDDRLLERGLPVAAEVVCSYIDSEFEKAQAFFAGIEETQATRRDIR
ncbi:hypothetical protein GQ600_5918 [Phytophthora cactorum]|nr:hypothetical protein GQ600_5918 [Phytophthora cactorum]